MGRIAILGGTGPEGLGLALRFAMVGEEVVIGSRQATRATAAAEQSIAQLRTAGYEGRLRGAENPAAIDGADLVVVATPFDALSELLAQVGSRLAGKIVLDVVNPLIRVDKQFTTDRLAEGSAAERMQTVLAHSRVVSAFKNESAEELNRVDHPVEGDVVVCSNDKEARERIMALVNRIPRYRAVNGGPLVNARALEAVTALLLNINRRYKAVTSIKILGLEDCPGQA